MILNKNKLYAVIIAACYFLSLSAMEMPETKAEVKTETPAVSYWQSILWNAIDIQDDRTAEMALDNGADPNIGPSDDKKPLAEAALRLKNQVLVTLLLQRGANPNISVGLLAGEDSSKSLILLLMRQYLKDRNDTTHAIIRQLFNNSQLNPTLINEILLAVTREIKLISLIPLILEYPKLNLNVRNPKIGITPLMQLVTLATMYPLDATILSIIQRVVSDPRININTPSNTPSIKGLTALDYAQRGLWTNLDRKQEVINLLTAHGAKNGVSTQATTMGTQQPPFPAQSGSMGTSFSAPQPLLAPPTFNPAPSQSASEIEQQIKSLVNSQVALIQKAASDPSLMKLVEYQQQLLNTLERQLANQPKAPTPKQAPYMAGGMQFYPFPSETPRSINQPPVGNRPPNMPIPKGPTPSTFGGTPQQSPLPSSSFSGSPKQPLMKAPANLPTMSMTPPNLSPQQLLELHLKYINTLFEFIHPKLAFLENMPVTSILSVEANKIMGNIVRALKAISTNFQGIRQLAPAAQPSSTVLENIKKQAELIRERLTTIEAKQAIAKTTGTPVPAEMPVSMDISGTSLPTSSIGAKRRIEETTPEIEGQKHLKTLESEPLSAPQPPLPFGDMPSLSPISLSGFSGLPQQPLMEAPANLPPMSETPPNLSPQYLFELRLNQINLFFEIVHTGLNLLEATPATAFQSVETKKTMDEVREAIKVINKNLERIEKIPIAKESILNIITVDNLSKQLDRAIERFKALGKRQATETAKTASAPLPTEMPVSMDISGTSLPTSSAGAKRGVEETTPGIEGQQARPSANFPLKRRWMSSHITGAQRFHPYGQSPAPVTLSAPAPLPVTPVFPETPEAPQKTGKKRGRKPKVTTADKPVALGIPRFSSRPTFDKNEQRTKEAYAILDLQPNAAPHVILGLPENASIEEIEKAHSDLVANIKYIQELRSKKGSTALNEPTAMEVDPDVTPDESASSSGEETDAMELINWANKMMRRSPYYITKRNPK